jgi:hypothetical protein
MNKYRTIKDATFEGRISKKKIKEAVRSIKMSRIKYRCWDPDTEEFKYNVSFDMAYEESNGMQISPCVWWVEDGMKISLALPEYEKYVNQWTGYKDTRSKDIDVCDKCFCRKPEIDL